jgi:bacteriochlorophyllide a dehydrogenase
MHASAVVLDGPGALEVRPVALAPVAGEVAVDIDWSGISTGTERLLWTGEMPPFPGMGYPLVPGYEAVGRIVDGPRAGEAVFVPGARCFGPVHGLFGASASRLFVPAERALPIGETLGERGVLLALAATAWHALAGGALPDLIVGHGVLGRLLARLCVVQGHAPVVWERQAARRAGASGYNVLDPEDDSRRDYAVICDASGDAGLLDRLIGRLRYGGEIVLAGFYKDRVSFAFPPAFMREARLRVAAQWQPDDLLQVRDLAAGGRLDLSGLLTHRCDAGDARDAYGTAFEDPSCLKMILDWRSCR